MADKFASMIEIDAKYEVKKTWFVPTSLPCCLIVVTGDREGATITAKEQFPEWRWVSLHNLEDHEHYPDNLRWRVKQVWRTLRYGRQANPYLEFNRVEEIEALIAALSEAKVEAFDQPIAAWSGNYQKPDVA